MQQQPRAPGHRHRPWLFKRKGRFNLGTGPSVLILKRLQTFINVGRSVGRSVGRQCRGKLPLLRVWTANNLGGGNAYPHANPVCGTLGDFAADDTRFSCPDRQHLRAQSGVGLLLVMLRRAPSLRQHHARRSLISVDHDMKIERARTYSYSKTLSTRRQGWTPGVKFRRQIPSPRVVRHPSRKQKYSASKGVLDYPPVSGSKGRFCLNILE